MTKKTSDDDWKVFLNKNRWDLEFYDLSFWIEKSDLNFYKI